jgi:hypothetical protein
VDNDDSALQARMSALELSSVQTRLLLSSHIEKEEKSASVLETKIDDLSSDITAMTLTVNMMLEVFNKGAGVIMVLKLMATLCGGIIMAYLTWRAVK